MSKSNEVAAMRLALEELVDTCIATYALHGTSDVMIVDDGKARNKLLSEIEEALTEQKSKKCGLCGEDRAFTGNCGGGRDKPNALCYEDPQQSQPAQPKKQEPVEKMTAHRAMYFMERFKREEKLLGPNEQAALDFVIAMLNTTPQQRPSRSDIKPLTDEQRREIILKADTVGQAIAMVEAAHGIKE